MLNEFKTFISRGNVMDMAVGIIIGAAFTAIVSSLVEDIINPIIGLFIGGIDLSGLGISLGEGEGAGFLAFGNFLMAVINFLIVAWAVFMLVKGVNSVKNLAAGAEEAPEEEADPEPSEKDILVEIRDALTARNG